MKEAELRRWWPDIGTVVAELRRIERSDVADRLLDAVRGGATSSEILGNIGLALREHRTLYSHISESAAAAWDAVMADVNRAYPGGRLEHWLTRLTRRLTGRAQRP